MMLFSILLSSSVAFGCKVESNLGDGWFTLRNDQIPSMGIFLKTPMEYIEGSGTYDTARETYTGAFPINVHWTDATNVQWRVSILNRSDGCTVAVPCNPSTMIYGDERDRVGMDKQVNACKFVFNYEPAGGLQPHGIRIQTNGYRYKGMGIYMSDSDQWKTVLALVKSGVDIASAAADVYSKAAKIYSGIPAKARLEKEAALYVKGAAPIRGAAVPYSDQFKPNLVAKLRSEIREAQMKASQQLVQFNRLKSMIRDAKQKLRDIDDFVDRVEANSQVEVADLSTAQVYLDRLERII